MNNKDVRQAEATARAAQQDLVDAKAFAYKGLPEAERIARKMARSAKRRRSKADRRAARRFCRSYEDEEESMEPGIDVNG